MPVMGVGAFIMAGIIGIPMPKSHQLFLFPLMAT